MLNLFYATKAEIPAGYEALYTERNGRVELTGVNGMKTQADIDTVLAAKEHEKAENAKLRQRFAPLLRMNEEEIKAAVAKLDEYDELKIKAEGNFDDKKIQSLVEANLVKRLAPVERERDQFKTQLDEVTGKVKEYEVSFTRRGLQDALREAIAAKPALAWRPSADPDVFARAEQMFERGEDGRYTTKVGVGVTPGITPDVWLVEMQPKAEHWFPESQGGGARGGNGGGGFPNNPFTAEHWNMTVQGQLLKTDRAQAEQLAKSAGTTIGGPKPAPKK